MNDDRQRLAQAVRDACVEVALRAHEEAGISGLCYEGRWEIALDAMRNVDLSALLKQPDYPAQPGKGGA